jgi:hypothetical protein
MKKAVIIPAILLTTTLSALLAVPYVAKAYLNQLRPNVYIDDVSWQSVGCFHLQGITHKSPAIDARILEASACWWNKSIHLQSGGVDISRSGGSTKDVSSAQNGFDGWAVSAQDISVTVQVNDFLDIHLPNMSLNNDTICSSNRDGEDIPGLVAHVKRPPYRIELDINNVCYNRNTHIATFDSGWVHSNADVTGKTYFDFVSTIQFQDGSIDLVSKDLRIKTVAPFMGISAFDMQITYDGQIWVGADKIIVDNASIDTQPVTFNHVRIPSISAVDVPVDVLWTGHTGQDVSVNVDVNSKTIFGEENCQDWLNALPKELLNSEIYNKEKFSDLHLVGRLGFQIRLDPEDPRLKLRNGCVWRGPIPPFITALTKQFSYTAYHANHKTTFQRETGPFRLDWVPLGSVSGAMAVALTTTEDPGFYDHRGVIPQAFENSLKDNLRLGKFFRGGSTLTMQLAKNLWLTRDRTLARKVKELFLTSVLESTLTKDQILELYLNVVEFGPDIYGIGAASQKLLNKHPAELSITEALYLTLRLPAPTRSASYQAQKGLIKKLLDNIAKSGKVPADLIELEKQGLTNDNSDIGTDD